MKSILFVSLALVAAQSALAAGTLTVTSSRVNEANGATLMLENRGEVVGELLCERGAFKPNPSVEGKSNYLLYIDGDTNPEFNIGSASTCEALFQRLLKASESQPVNVDLGVSGSGQNISRSVGRIF